MRELEPRARLLLSRIIVFFARIPHFIAESIIFTSAGILLFSGSAQAGAKLDATRRNAAVYNAGFMGRSSTWNQF
jgi:hypothetical protein